MKEKIHQKKEITASKSVQGIKKELPKLWKSFLLKDRIQLRAAGNGSLSVGVR